jgi:hypothetical protein
LHVSQFVLDGDDPHIAFEEKKNGPGTVAIHYGVHTVSDHIDQLAEADGWQRDLFPSPSDSNTHVHSDTITNRFKRLAERADVSVDRCHLRQTKCLLHNHCTVWYIVLSFTVN